MTINNSNGGIYTEKTANVKNAGGDMRLVNTGEGIYIVKGSKVENDGNLYMSNTGKQGLVIGGDVKNTNGKLFNLITKQVF